MNHLKKGLDPGSKGFSYVKKARGGCITDENWGGT
jgi:hypothetical protein